MALIHQLLPRGFVYRAAFIMSRNWIFICLHVSLRTVLYLKDPDLIRRTVEALEQRAEAV